MHVDLIEALRCPHPHADGWLVASVDVVVDRRITRGTVACPLCGQEWEVRDGALHLGAAPLQVARGIVSSNEHDDRADALRTAALLDLREAQGVVVLAGEAAHVADALVALTGVQVLAVNPPDGIARAHSRLYVQDALPLGVETLRGARLDAAHASVGWLESTRRAVARGARVIAPASVALPADLTELARDDREWVAEVRVGASGLVPLRRGGDPMA
jgi:hypothetical protein